MTALDELLDSPLSQVGALLRSKEVSPVELATATLERIERWNSVTRTFITVLDDLALREARAAEADLLQGTDRGPLHGIPYSIKDCIATQGIRTTAGSAILSDYVPDYDSTVATRTRAAGGVLVGKNNLHEFAMGVSNDNPHYGRAGNPWDLGRIPGGSSGASASAVALGLSYFSYGTDGAGSVRIPAGLCGVIGLKAGYGVISRYGMVPPIPPNQDHGPGILGRTAEDVALVLQAIVGRDENDPVSRDFDAPDYRGGLNRDLRGLRIGVPTNFYFDQTDPEVEQAVRAAAGTLAGMGMEVEEVRIPYLDEAMAVTFVGGLAEFHRKALKERRQDYGEDIRYRLMAGAFTQASDAARAQRITDIFKASMAKVMTRFDALVAPTTRMPAYEFDAETLAVGAHTFNLKEPLVPSVLGTGLTRPSNMSGNPAISIPCGYTRSNLPIGLQVIGRDLGEPLLLAIAHQFASTSGNQVRRPPQPSEAAPAR